ncbi:MAG: hypothetical protein L0214_13015 [candidate division NC10 bacterium]|nr:hypothetical protein [candidate division NC10 bacterium]
MSIVNVLREMLRRPAVGRRPLRLESLEERCMLSYTLIADDAGAFALPGRPALNEDGTVAFRARHGAGVDFIFTSAGGPLTLIAVTKNAGDAFAGDHPINSQGAVAFRTTFGAGGQAIFTSRA